MIVQRSKGCQYLSIIHKTTANEEREERLGAGEGQGMKISDKITPEVTEKGKVLCDFYKNK